MLNKAIEHGKEKRKPYRGAKAVDYTCRNHKSCPWCKGNRTNKDKEKKKIADDQITDKSKADLSDYEY